MIFSLKAFHHRDTETQRKANALVGSFCSAASFFICDGFIKFLKDFKGFSVSLCLCGEGFERNLCAC